MSTFNPPAPLNPLTKARSVDINSLTDSVATAFAALPSDSDLNNGTVNFGIDSGTANTYIVTLPRVPTAYVDGLRVVFTPLNSNTGASTVNVNGLGVKSIRLQDNTATEPGTLVAGIPKTLIYGQVLGNFFVEANSVTSAMNAAAAAAASAGAAAGSASAAATSASNASTSEANAAISAANAGSTITANSATSFAIGLGIKVVTIEENKQFPVDVPVRIYHSATEFVVGPVVSYVGPTLTINATDFGGSGTFNTWKVSLAGVKGATGGTAGGSLTDALNEKKGATPASSATPDVWSAGGNRVPITSTTGWTGLPDAPQPGSKRTAVAEVAFPITSSANFFVHGGSTMVNAGDELDIVAETISTFKVTVRRNNGSLSLSPRNLEILKTSQPWTAKVTGVHQIVLVGAAASGGVAVGGSGARVAASGASTAGVVLKSFYAVAGDSYMLSLGARGASVSVTSASQATAGNDAFDSTFVGTGVALTAGGGKKGNATLNASGTAVALGAVGGTATGGDINITGSPSGTVTVQSSGSAGASGGAASPFKGPPSGSGDVSVNGTAQARLASGGAGIGGTSGSVIGTDLGGAASAGAGSFGASPNITTTTIGAVPGVGVDSEFASILTLAPLKLIDAGSAASDTGATIATVGGSGSGASIGTAVSRSSGTVTFMGGSGGVAVIGNTAGLTLASGSVTYGGASGGVASGSNATPSQTMTAGAGGAAFAIIQSP